jgi:hypothetical protein
MKENLDGERRFMLDSKYLKKDALIPHWLRGSSTWTHKKGATAM